MTKKIILITLLIISPLSYPEEVDFSEEEGLIALFGDEELISIATGIAQPISKAPAVASVITSEQIKKIGATDIDEVLETIPGLHVARDTTGYNPLYVFRGVNASFNPQVLVLVNGIPLTNLFQGDRNLVWGGMPVEAISRIEVIRGPGSALYGADAFAGVINIVTKTSSEVSGFSSGVRGGSFNTRDFWFKVGGEAGELDYLAILEMRSTDGQDEKITADAQTLLDLITVGQVAPVSNAPGPPSLSRENYDARFELGYRNVKLRAGAQIRDDLGVGAGVAQVLDPNARFSSRRWNADITYDNPEFAKNIGLTVQLSYLDVSQEVEEDLVLFPAGSAGPFVDPLGNPLLGFFPDGIIGNPEVLERHTRFNISSSYSGLDKNEFRFGIGYYYGDLYEVREEKNFGEDPSNCVVPNTPGTCLPIFPGSGLVEVTDTPFVFLEEDDRENYYVFLQDVIQLSNDWELTAGIRYDDYSDFGSTVNPRLALVWSTAHNLTTKLLYGEAFRAPSFVQTRAINNPVLLGNPNLDPEEMESYELAFDYQPAYNVGLNLNFFYYQWDDIIQFVPDPGGVTSTAQNAGEQTGYGMEFEATWELNEQIDFTGNLAWQQSTDEELDSDAANSPQKQVYLQANWKPADDWTVNLQANWVIDRNRMSGDLRSEVDDYVLVDLTVRKKELFKGLEVAFLVKNLFDEDAREPSPNGVPVPSIPDDLPLAGRSVLGEVRYQF